MNEQKTLFEDEGGPDIIPDIIECGRCRARCRIDGPPGDKAKMLRLAQGPGLCVNCAVHDFLRNTYPPNILLAQSGPRALLAAPIQRQFAEIMRLGFADAKPDEIDWQRIVDNWDLPFPHKMKRGNPMNPVSQEELDEIASGKRPALGINALGINDHDLTITSVNRLNNLSPGMGDDLKNIFKKNKRK